MPDVERRGRLVEQEDPGLRRDRAREEHALPLALRERGERAGGERRCVRQPQRAIDGFVVACRSAHAPEMVRVPALRHDARDSERRAELGLLRDVRGEARSLVRAELARIVPVQPDVALGGHDAGERLEEGGFARPVRAEHGEHASEGRRERHAVDDDPPPATHAQPGDADGLSHAPPPAASARAARGRPARR
ncbi:hypothetical protein BE15_43910 [Sorangium cellulosum]|uniref:Uncharacterized protein n=1 Tax=Sorangium cellulosum TaxID=56 RepID=A0A150Q7W1_SORCE|nr:hypothetical protein BE15_43910 [Sorangium cellulosum]